jgi:hypothetical protein
MTNISTVPSPPPAPSTDGSPSDRDSGAKSAVARVADEAPAQAARVVGDAKTQVSDAARRAVDDLRTQADERATRAAQGLRDLSTRADALASGRTDEAGNLADLAQSAGRQAQQFADRLDDRGIQGVADDLARFGRQHPLAFVGLSLGAGFIAGRLLRTTAAVVQEENRSGTSAPTLPAPAPTDEPAVGNLAEVRV